MTNARPQVAPAAQDRIFLSLCTDADTVEWCKLAEEYTRALFDNVEVLYYTPGDPFPEELENWEGEWIISFRGDLIIPPRIYNRATKGAVNFHPSPPWFRGLGGAQYAIYEGHETFGTTAHHLAKSVDTGSIVDVKYFTLAPGETVSSLRHQVGAASLAQFFELMAKYWSTGVPLPASEEKWGEKLYTKAALLRWIEEKKAVEPDHRCFR